MEQSTVFNQVEHYMASHKKDAYAIAFLLPFGVSVLMGMLTSMTFVIPLLGVLVFLMASSVNIALPFVVSNTFSKHIQHDVRSKQSTQDFINEYQTNGFRFFKANLARMVSVQLWSLLFVVPGYIKSFAYSMTPYILSDKANIGVFEALKQSDALMKGHKMALFKIYMRYAWSMVLTFAVLFISFFGFLYIALTPVFSDGWVSIAFLVMMLALMLCSILSFFVLPRLELAKAYFYEQIK